MLDLVERLVALLTAHASPGRLADTRGAEAVLARACVVLTDWENAYRAGELPTPAAALWADPATTAADLLDAVPDHQVTELIALATRAHTCGMLTRLTPAPATPGARPRSGGIAGPVLIEHWADADLLIPTIPVDASGGSASLTPPPPGGMTLLDVKTVLTVRNPARVARWLWQLLAYAWLDPADRYRIRAVGLYLARHGTLITWPLEQYAEGLLDGRNPDVGSAAFRQLASRVIATETGRATHGHAASR